MDNYSGFSKFGFDLIIQSYEQKPVNYKPFFYKLL